MFWILVSIILAISTLWFLYLKPFSYWKKMGVKQTNPWIFLGDSWPSFIRSMSITEWIQWVYNMHPGTRYSGMYQFYSPTLVIRDPELVKQLAVKDFDHFTDHNSFITDDEYEPMWMKNLIALKGQKWRDMRMLLSGSFTSSKMRIMYSLIASESEKFVEHFLNKNEEVVELEIKDAFARFTSDVIATTSFGIKVDSLSEPNNEFYLMGKEVTNFTGLLILFKFLAFMVFPWLFKVLKISIFPKKISNFFNSLINETIRVREEKGIVRPDMINILLEAKKGVNHEETHTAVDTGFAVVHEASSDIVKPSKRSIEITNQDITSQAMLFFIAGFETVSSEMCFTAYELAVNPDCQEKLRKEIRETRKECNGKVTYDALVKMKYMDMVISESLRKWPVAIATDRVCVKPYTIEPTNPDEKPVDIRVKDSIFIPIYGIHMDPENYPDPDKFVPERFSDENKDNIKPYTYMPFGVGPRACIGSRFALMEIKSLFFNLLDKFEIVPVGKSVIPMQLSKKKFNMAPDDGFWFGLKPIKE